MTGQPEDLAEAYAAAVDARDWSALGQLFLGDAVLVTPDPPRSLDPVVEAHGRDAIVATIQAVANFERTQHLVTDSIWEVGEGTAAGRTVGEAHHVVGGETPHSWVWFVEYADTCVLTGTGWRFSRRALTVRQIERRAGG